MKVCSQQKVVSVHRCPPPLHSFATLIVFCLSRTNTPSSEVTFLTCSHLTGSTVDQRDREEEEEDYHEADDVGRRDLDLSRT